MVGRDNRPRPSNIPVVSQIVETETFEQAMTSSFTGLTCYRCGVQAVAIVCQHIARSFHASDSVGFNVIVVQDADDDIYSAAYCHKCRQLQMKRGLARGNVGMELDRQIGREFVCASCFDTAKQCCL